MSSINFMLVGSTVKVSFQLRAPYLALVQMVQSYSLWPIGSSMEEHHLVIKVFAVKPAWLPTAPLLLAGRQWHLTACSASLTEMLFCFLTRFFG